MFVVAGVSGQTGKVVAETLLAASRKVRVVVRNAKAGEALRAKGAEVAIARLDDAEALARALAGAEGAYLLLPPDYASTDTLGDKARMTRAIAAAIEASRVPHVVFLSSIGAHLDGGTGPIQTVAYAERELAKIGTTRFTFLRPAYFIENVANVLAPAREQGVLPSMFDPKKRVPMIATSDIGRFAAKSLVEGPAGARTSIVELAGPRELSFDDLAAELTGLLGRNVATVRVPGQAVQATLEQAGMPRDLAGLYAEMLAGFDSGLVTYEGGAARFARGDTEARDVLARLLQG